MTFADDFEKLLKDLDIGLSRILRYSYGDFLLIALALIVNRWTTLNVIKGMGLELTILSALCGRRPVHQAWFELMKVISCGSPSLGLKGEPW
jgi:hypothetical protein